MPCSILVIEDDPVMIAFLDEYLSQDFETRVEQDATAAFGQLGGANHPALIIPDLRGRIPVDAAASGDA